MIEQITAETGRAPDKAPQSSGGETLYCGHCGEPNAADSRFCVCCGSALATPVGAGPGEHTAAAKATPPPAAAGNAIPYKACGCCVGTVCAHDHLAGFGSEFVHQPPGQRLCLRSPRNPPRVP